MKKKRTRLNLVIENPDGITDKEVRNISKIVLDVLKREFPSWDWEDEESIEIK